jgi:hypothetical protein
MKGIDVFFHLAAVQVHAARGGVTPRQRRPCQRHLSTSSRPRLGRAFASSSSPRRPPSTAQPTVVPITEVQHPHANDTLDAEAMLYDERLLRSFYAKRSPPSVVLALCAWPVFGLALECLTACLGIWSIATQTCLRCMTAIEYSTLLRSRRARACVFSNPVSARTRMIPVAPARRTRAISSSQERSWPRWLLAEPKPSKGSVAEGSQRCREDALDQCRCGRVQ